MAIFFEIQYYAGGSQAELVPAGARPAVLPDKESVGPQSTELELKRDDYAVELSLFRHQGRNVVWLGYFIRGIDTVHGDRGNVWGVGAWLVDVAPISVTRLLKFLKRSAEKIVDSRKVGAEVRAELEKVAGEFSDLHWSVAFERLPSTFWSPRFDVEPGRTAYIAIPEQSGLFLIAADILHQFTRKPGDDEVPASRRLYLPRRSSNLPASLLSNLDPAAVFGAEEEAILGFCDAASEPIRAQKETEARIRALEDSNRRMSSNLQSIMDGAQNLFGQQNAFLEQLQSLADGTARPGGGRAAPVNIWASDKTQDILHAIQQSIARLERGASTGRVKRSEPRPAVKSDFRNGPPPADTEVWTNGATTLDVNYLLWIATIAIAGIAIVGVIVLILSLFDGAASGFRRMFDW